MKKRANLLFACVALLIAVLACNIRNNPNPRPLETAAALVNTPGGILTALPTDLPGPPPPSPTPPPFESGIFYFFPDNATFTGLAYPGSLYDFCGPPQTMDSGAGFLKVIENKTLVGYCTSDSKDGTIRREGNLSGIYDPQTRQVSFTLITSKTFSPSADAGVVTMSITLTGSAVLAGKVASGVGNFDYNCSADGEFVNCIDDQKTLILNGTMPFTLELYP